MTRSSSERSVEGMDPTQVANIRVIGPDGNEIVPAVGTVYRTSDEAGEFTEDLVFVAMTQGQYNQIQGMLTPKTVQEQSWGTQVAP